MMMKSAGTVAASRMLVPQRQRVALLSSSGHHHHHHRYQQHYGLLYRYSFASNNNSAFRLMLKQYKTTMTKRTSSSATTTSAVTTTPTRATTTSAAWLVPSVARRAWNAYTHSLHQRPLLTKAVLASFIFFTSDSIAQYLVCHNKSSSDDRAVVVFEWNAVRALSGASFGVVATVWLHYWWGFLETLVVHFNKRRMPLQYNKLANTAVKVLLDQAIGAPLYIYSYYVLTNFFSELGTSTNSRHIAQTTTISNMEDSSTHVSDWWNTWKHCHAKAADMLWPTMWQHWRVWVPVHSVNFYLVPLHHRVLVQNSVLVFWSGYLSHLNHQQQRRRQGEMDHQVWPQHQQQQQQETMTTTVIATTTTPTAKTERRS